MSLLVGIDEKESPGKQGSCERKKPAMWFKRPYKVLTVDFELYVYLCIFSIDKRHYNHKQHMDLSHNGELNFNVFLPICGYSCLFDVHKAVI